MRKLFFFSPASRNRSCVKLIISHCSKLNSINNSFLKVPDLCYLDLSYNNLHIIDHNWINWTSLHKGVNLQGNPIDCTCSSQWLIDFLVPLLHAKQQFHQYLSELRCASPNAFKEHRLIRYFKHDSSFCKDEV